MLFTWLSLEEVLRLVGGDVRDGSKDIGTVSSRSLDTVPDDQLSHFLGNGGKEEAYRW